MTDVLDGLIHASDISWDNSGEDKIKEYSVDQKIKFKILDIDVEKERVSLGIKQLTKDTNKSDKLINKTMTCVIQKINEDKILVNFENDLNGFVKKTNLAKLKQNKIPLALLLVKKLMQKL